MTLLNLHLRIILILLVLPAISIAGHYKVTRVVDGDTINIPMMALQPLSDLLESMPLKLQRGRMNRGNRSAVKQPSTLPALC